MFQQRRTLDELGRTLLITGIVCTILGTLVFRYGTWPRWVLSIVAAAALISCVLRMFSRNQARCYQQNLRFLTAWTAVRGFFRRLFGGSGGAYAHRARKARKNPTWNEIRQYKYFICPQCTQRLRVPRGKGRLRVTCTRCGHVFETKS
ncbi:MAG: hypothetical protein Q4C13_02800 [Clostridia bacterium]|nr:hypothetical protein [Clostridia bacterium]